MNVNNHIQEELHGLGVTEFPAALSQPYAVPQGYFDNLADLLLNRVRSLGDTTELSAAEEMESISPLLAGLSRKMPFSVPQGYFEQTVSAGEEDLAFIASLPRNMPMAVPEAYFETLPDIILARVRPVAKVVPMFRRTWMKMAVAASILGILTLGTIRYFNQPKDITVENPQWVATKLQNIPDKALDEFVQTSDISGSTAKSRSQSTAEKSALLKDVSDKELQAFLDQVPDEELGIN